LLEFIKYLEELQIINGENKGEVDDQDLAYNEFKYGG
jgi:hypothetical protein